MMIFSDTRLVFAAMPKTGGSWVGKVMPRLGYGRLIEGIHAHDLNQLHVHKLAGRKVFTVLRNPITWLESFWKYTTREPPQLHSFGGPCGILTPYLDWDWPVFRDPIIVESLVEDIFYAYRGNADYVLRQEHLCDDLAAMLNIEGLKFDRKQLEGYPRANVSDDRETPWTDNCREAFYKHNPSAFYHWERAGIKREV